VTGFYLCAFFVINIVAMILTKVRPLAALKYIFSLLPFVIFAAVFNFALGFWEDALFLTARLILICNITQCYKKVVSASDLSSAIEKLFTPLKLFKIDSKDIGLMVCISLAFIPVLRRDFNHIRLALAAKGMKLSFKTLKYVLKPFFIGIFQRTDEISDALKAKAYAS
jgi:energy-coupling factor transport system permease protein